MSLYLSFWSEYNVYLVDLVYAVIVSSVFLCYYILLDHWSS